MEHTENCTQHNPQLGLSVLLNLDSLLGQVPVTPVYQLTKPGRLYLSDPLSVTPASSQLSLRLTSADMMIIDASLNRCRLARAATTTSDLPSSSNKFQRSSRSCDTVPTQPPPDNHVTHVTPPSGEFCLFKFSPSSATRTVVTCSHCTTRDPPSQYELRCASDMFLSLFYSGCTAHYV
jgi:hypothetical protein